MPIQRKAYDMYESNPCIRHYVVPSAALKHHTRCVQVKAWYDEVLECRHVYIQRHFCVGDGRVHAEDCVNACDYCARTNGMNEIVTAYRTACES